MPGLLDLDREFFDVGFPGDTDEPLHAGAARETLWEILYRGFDVGETGGLCSWSKTARPSFRHD